MRYRAIAPVCLILLGMGLWTGCGPDNPLNRLPVSGEVQLDGLPLDQGTIRFTPEGKEGVASGALITNGQYAIPTEDGLPVGKYRVRINAPEGAGAGSDPNQPPGPTTAQPARERIPPKYNTQSEIVEEVTADGPNEFSYDIPTK